VIINIIYDSITKRFLILTLITFVNYVYIFCQTTKLIFYIVTTDLVMLCYFIKKIKYYKLHHLYHFKTRTEISTKLIIYFFTHLFLSILLYNLFSVTQIY